MKGGGGESRPVARVTQAAPVEPIGLNDKSTDMI
jgi:hypothetical protein